MTQSTNQTLKHLGKHSNGQSINPSTDQPINQRHTHTGKQTHKQTSTHTNPQASMQTNKHTHTQANRGHINHAIIKHSIQQSINNQ